MERSSNLTGQLTGLATMISGLLWAVGGSTALNYDNLGIAMTGPHLLLSVGGLLSLIGLASLARHQARDYGRVSEVGAILASAGVVQQKRLLTECPPLQSDSSFADRKATLEAML